MSYANDGGKHYWGPGEPDPLAPTDLYAAWMREVDREVSDLMGLGVDDLPDCLYRDWFNDGVSPHTAARRAVRKARANLGY